jgi:hypothetical protein
MDVLDKDIYPLSDPDMRGYLSPQQAVTQSQSFSDYARKSLEEAVNLNQLLSSSNMW